MGSGMSVFSSLFARLALVFLGIVALLGSGLLVLSQQVSEHYSQEVLQRLNQPVAGYITEQKPLLNEAGEVDETVLDELASHAMILNPALEIYILDLQGRILSHRLPPGSVKTSRVNLTPVFQYLDGKKPWPILGSDPRTPDSDNVFSTAPILNAESSEPQGYVYTVVGGQLYQQLRESAYSSYAMTIGVALMVVGLLAAAIAGCVVFFILTRRLAQLRKTMLHFDLLYPDLAAIEVLQPLKKIGTNQPKGKQSLDEVDQLTIAFGQMASHIHQQFSQLQSLDNSRRELIANVSHDLRTPLASMQGYIETALIRSESLCDTEFRDYLSISIRHCQRLSHLIDELFELSRLQSDTAEPKLEPFSLLELAYDSVQEFSMKAADSGVTLRIDGSSQAGFVVADIAMIQRVLQNLIDNAIRHTDAGGEVVLSLVPDQAGTEIRVSDTGHGISRHEIPHIFDRYYQSHGSSSSAAVLPASDHESAQTEPHEPASPRPAGSSGLGLAIVKRILDLHNSVIDVESELNKGTTFRFVLSESV